MPSPEELARQFNEAEALWRCYQTKRPERRHRFRLRSRRGEKLLDQLDWLAAERQMRPIRAIGKRMDR